MKKMMMKGGDDQDIDSSHAQSESNGPRSDMGQAPYLSPLSTLILTAEKQLK